MVIESQKADMCIHTSSHIDTSRVFVSDGRALLEDIQSEKSLGSFTVLSLREKRRMTCQLQKQPRSDDNSRAERHEGQKIYFRVLGNVFLYFNKQLKFD